MPIVGLTGGIASGKSTVARMFADLGAEVVDADRLAREAVAPGEPALEAIQSAFGPRALSPDGTLDRAWMGEQVFASEEVRRRLNGIVHPAVLRALEARIQAVRERPTRAGEPPPILIAEIPLLIEEGLADRVDKIILVVAKQTSQVQRLMRDKGLSEAQAWARVRAQFPVERKRPHADWIIDGEAPLPQIAQQVRSIWATLAGAPTRPDLPPPLPG